MSSATEKLLKLADEAERTAAAYRMAAAALNGHAVDKRGTRSEAVLGDAIAIDAARRERKPKPAKPAKAATRRKQTGEATREKLAIRERTARVLAIVEDKGPMTSDAITEAVGGSGRIGFAPLLNAGYLKAVGDKYKRTAKPFVVDWRGK
jgi:hypothetical protein